MKRQRKAGSPKAKTSSSSNIKKKSKPAPDMTVVAEGGMGGVPTQEEVAEWASLWSAIDEEMSWAGSWCPFWEITEEGNGEAYHALYDDVLWDYDIWGLKTAIIPTTSNTHYK